MKMRLHSVWGQTYLLPYVKITNTRALNGDLELIIGWLSYGISFSI